MSIVEQYNRLKSHSNDKAQILKNTLKERTKDLSRMKFPKDKDGKFALRSDNSKPSQNRTSNNRRSPRK